MKVPFGDLKAQYLTIKKEIDDSIRKVIDESAFTKGKYVKTFEEKYADKCDVKNCIGVANGTDALYIAQRSLGIGKGDEVITVANSWISTSETITQTGAKPVFVDIESNYYNIDTSKIEDKITKRTKAIIPVHLYGQPADMRPILDICDDRELHLIEDCAQAHFATYNGRKVGNFGDAGTFSFYPGKNLGAYGDAGAIVTNDDNLAKEMRKFANHGALKKHIHEIEGVNSRLDGIQAAILSVKLKHIDEWDNARNNNAMKYSERLRGIKEITIPKIREDSSHVFHLYVIRAEQRDALKSYLEKKGIQTGLHYPTPLPFLDAYSRYNYKNSDFPVAYKNMKEILSLPIYPELEERMIDFVCDSIIEFYG